MGAQHQILLQMFNVYPQQWKLINEDCGQRLKICKSICAYYCYAISMVAQLQILLQIFNPYPQRWKLINEDPVLKIC